MKNKAVLFTYDYELFLGSNSGTVEECLLQPTDKLLEIHDRYKFKAIFFIDTLYLWRLKNEKDNEEEHQKNYTAIVNQLRRILADGHYIFPHIHPHWMDAVYNKERKTWGLDNLRYYMFGSLPQNLQKDLFDISVTLIDDITNSVVPGYRIDCYRAGGWSIQPFAGFLPHFKAHRILYDLSVIPGKYQSSDAHNFDFRSVNESEKIYSFSDDVCKKDPGGSFKELTISAISFSRFETWVDFKLSGLLKRMKLLQRNNGTTVNSKVISAGDIFVEKNGKRIVASFEGSNFLREYKLFKAIRNNNFFQFISHPKLLSHYDLRRMNAFFKRLGKLTIETDYKKIL